MGTFWKMSNKDKATEASRLNYENDTELDLDRYYLRLRLLHFEQKAPPEIMKQACGHVDMRVA